MAKQFLSALGVFLVVAVVFVVVQVVTPDGAGFSQTLPPGTPVPPAVGASPPAPPAGTPPAASALSTLRIRNAVFEVEIADDPDEQTRGLSFRESLPADQGILFVFAAEGLYNFWMKDMRFSIDIIWIRDNLVAGVTENAPPEGANPALLYGPPEPVDQVLEVNAGIVAQFGIRAGDEVVMAR